MLTLSYIAKKILLIYKSKLNHKIVLDLMIKIRQDLSLL